MEENFRGDILRKTIFTHRFDLIIGRYKLENSRKLLSFFSFLLSLFASSGGDRSRRPIFDSIHRESDGTIVIWGGKVKGGRGCGSERQQDGSCCHRGHCFSLGTSLYRTNATRIVKESIVNMMGKVDESVKNFIKESNKIFYNLHKKSDCDHGEWYILRNYKIVKSPRNRQKIIRQIS